MAVDDEVQPLTPAQRRMYFLHQLDPLDPAYNTAMAIDVRGPLAVAQVRQAIQAVTRRHPALLTRFVAEPACSGWPAPVRITDRGSVDLARLVDLTGVPHADRKLRELLSEAQRRPLDLEAGPVAVWTLFRLGPSRHVLHLVVHHIVFDLASVAVLTRDLERLCGRGAAGRPADLPALNPPPADPPPERVAADVAYWVERLADAPPQRPLWDDGTAATPAAVTAVEHLPHAVATRLAAVAAARGCTPFLIVAAALAVAVTQYTGQDDIVIGTPVALDDVLVRDRIDLRVNLLPLRLAVCRNETFAELLGRARSAALDAMEHRHAPFERVVDALRLPRDRAATPLFRVLLAHQPGQRPPLLPSVETTALPTDAPAAKYHLSVTATDTPTGMELAVEADARETRDTTVAAFAQHVVALLVRACADPEARVADLIRPERPRRTAERPARRPPGRERCGLHTLVERAAGAVPDAVAVRAAGGDLTYRHLDRRANRIARHLAAHGAGPGRIVAVRPERDVHLIPLLLGVLKSGAAYLPLDVSTPPARQRAMLADAEPTILVASGDGLGFSGTLLRPDDSAIDDLPATPFRKPPHAAELAYVLYTSGSSGAPKGVAIEHGSAVEFIRWAIKAFSQDELATTLATTSLAFDLSVFEIFAPLAAGATVLLTATAPDFGPLVARGRATLLNTVPSVLAAMLDGGLLPHGLRAVNLAGEPLSEDLVARVAAVRPNAVIRNLYGPSEATTYATAAVVAPGRTPGIGTSVADARIRLTDRTGAPVPPAATGEIRIGGGALARGYLHRPGLTAAAFVPDDLGLESGRRLYRTGDLARPDHADGLRFVGRVDHQVKIRGVRVEPEEVEAHLRAHPAVRDAAVVATRTTPPRLVAFVCGFTDRVATPEELAAHLRTRLLGPMVPERWSTLAALPRTSNGKVDRNALSRRASEAAPAAPGPAPPRTQLERTIARIWCAVLRQPSVGVHDGFFDVGGNSLVMLALLHRLREEVDPHLRLVDVFRFPTVAALAAHLSHPTAADTAVAQATAAGLRRRAAASGRLGRKR
ncbi:amino acid adenylation domain-containing protein [Actinokineospora guangxiensis]|uniref:Amino acid adenylation domain-containing protein n=1 Tax=Actinokineospora guangxiensis TaxID=1490288 RepID=A0ABW0ERF6_9PSEU